MSIAEPMTFVTDLLVAVVAFVCARRIWLANREPRMTSRSYWALGLLALGVAALAGGFAHGLAPVFSATVERVLWRMVFFSMGLVSYSMIVGTAYAVTRNPLRLVILLFAATAFVFYAIWMARNTDFRFVVLDYGVALLLVGVLAAIALIREEQPANMRWLLLAIVVTTIASVIQQSGFSLHRNFNHNDLYHVIGAIGIWCFYRGVRGLLDVGTVKSAIDSSQDEALIEEDPSASTSESMGASDSANPPGLDVESHRAT